jgi:hypothetical protein
MQKLVISFWCLLPLGGLAYHLGPGQERVQLDDAARAAAEARAHVRAAEALTAADVLDTAAADIAAEWALAVAGFERALDLLPAGHDAARRALVLERARARMLCSELPRANAELAALVEELADDPGADAALVRDAQRAWASSEYYMTWLQRLEGAPREEWEPRIEGARQTYKQLAQDADASAEERRTASEDLESAIRLARMDLAELQGLPLPSQ